MMGMNYNIIQNVFVDICIHIYTLRIGPSVSVKDYEGPRGSISDYQDLLRFLDFHQPFSAAAKERRCVDPSRHSCRDINRLW